MGNYEAIYKAFACLKPSLHVVATAEAIDEATKTGE